MLRTYGVDVVLLCFAVAFSGTVAAAPDDSITAIQRASAFGALTVEAERHGEVPVIVRLEGPRVPGLLRSKGRREHFRQILRERKAAIALEQEAVTSALPGRIRRIHRFTYLPYLAMQADAETLEQLQAMPQVLGVYPDRAHPPSLDVSVPLVGATPTQTAGYDGGGQAVAILDTGVNLGHQFFTNVTVPAEACFSGTVVGGFSSVTSFCDAGLPACTRIDESTGLPKDIPYSECGPGAADACTGDGLCWHGTHVAGIAVGNGGGRYGTARGADLIPIQVFVKHSSSGLVAYDSDLIAALEHVLDLSESIEIAAVNMSLAGDAFFSTTACDASSPSFKEAIDNLRAVGIATVIAAGNGSVNDGISFPSCISSAISVGATNDGDAIASFSNRSSALSLYAPGRSIYSSTLGSSSYGNASGTSMAAPHVAGAMAILKEKALADLPVSLPGESCQGGDLCMDDLASVLTSSLRLTGKSIIDGSTGFETPRIQVDAALGILANPPAVDLILDAELVLGNESDIACDTSQLDVCVVDGTFDRLSSLAEYGCVGYAYKGCSALTDSYGGDALVGAAAGENTIRYRPDLPADMYDVSVWWQSFPGLNTSAAEAVVKHTYGIRKDLPLLDQTSGGGGWNHLGTFFLDDASYVQLSDAAFPGLLADAIRFSAVGPIDPLTVATSQLQVAYVGYLYGYYLGALGGIPPYSWETLDGALPQGLTLDRSTGLISGTAEKAETASFRVQVVDDIGYMAERGLTLTSTNDAPPPVPLSDDFSDGDFAGWTVVDEGTVSAPSAWSAASEELVQASNIYGGDSADASALPKPGTYAVYDGGYGWSDYRVTLSLRSDDDDAVGLMFRVQDAEHYYRFSWDKQRSYRRLVKNVGGVFTLLAEDTVPYVHGQTYQLDILVQGELIEVRIDGVLVFSVTDASLAWGSIAAYSWGNVGARFDDIRLVDLAGANQPPIISALTATPAAILDTQSSQLAVAADDLDSGPNAALTYQWTISPDQGSLDDATSAMPVFMPPDVSATTSYTLTVAVWDGEATVSDSVVVTVSDADAPPPVLEDDFADGDFAGWTVVDEGTVSAPSAWSAASEELVQASNIYGGDSADASALPKPGTYAVYDGGYGWSDYRVTLSLRSDDDDAVGLMFRVQDAEHYYRFSWDKQRSYRRLVKNVGGVFTLLDAHAVPYVQGQTYQLDILVQGELIEVRVDGVLVFSVTDASLAGGSIAAYSWGVVGARFDNIHVD